MSMASQRKQAKCNGFWRKRGDAHSCWVQRLNARVLLAQKIELPKGKNRFYQMSRKTGPSIVEQKPAPQMRGSTLENMYLWEVVFWISCSLEKLYSWKRCTFGGLHFEGVVLVHVGSGSNSKLSWLLAAMMISYCMLSLESSGADFPTHLMIFWSLTLAVSPLGTGGSPHRPDGLCVRHRPPTHHAKGARSQWCIPWDLYHHRDAGEQDRRGRPRICQQLWWCDGRTCASFWLTRQRQRRTSTSIISEYYILVIAYSPGNAPRETARPKRIHSGSTLQAKHKDGNPPGRRRSHRAEARMG